MTVRIVRPSRAGAHLPRLEQASRQPDYCMPKTVHRFDAGSWSWSLADRFCWATVLL